MPKGKKKFNLEAEISLITGVYWIMGQSGLNYDDKPRDELIDKIKENYNAKNR
jgi:hypothetical protein